MKKYFILFLFILPLTLAAQEDGESTFQKEFAGYLEFNSGRVLQLAEAIPEDVYDWAPAEGVRSVSKALLHIASANYFFSTFFGAEIPEGINPMTLENEVTGKANIIETVKKSYTHISEVGLKVPDDQFLDKVNFPNGMEFNKRMTLMIAIGHVEEHLGQLIAYARSNGIAPPWSQ